VVSDGKKHKNAYRNFVERLLKKGPTKAPVAYLFLSFI
jgi:hypothetical protein